MAAPGECPFTIDAPVMVQRWERLTFLHWPFDPGLVQALLPAGLEVETYDGLAWVGLVPFEMRVSTPGDRSLPWVSNFCETNVRTYVRDGGGRSGIWFFSLDAARLGAVVVARTTYQLPYFWSAMSLVARDKSVSYSCRRRAPGPRGVRSLVEVEVGEPYQADELGPRDHFLTARWMLFSEHGRGIRSAKACHPPWPLQRAQVQGLDDRLVEVAGLPRPAGDPLVHYSPGVRVLIGRPER